MLQADDRNMVAVARLRVRVIAALDTQVQDAVWTGQIRDEVGVFALLEPIGVQEATLDQIVSASPARSRCWAICGGSPREPVRASILASLPDSTPNEITDMGIIISARSSERPGRACGIACIRMIRRSSRAGAIDEREGASAPREKPLMAMDRLKIRRETR
jgi:hypothetical protein